MSELATTSPVTTHCDGAAFARRVGLPAAQGSGAEQAVKGAVGALARPRRMVDERTAGVHP